MWTSSAWMYMRSPLGYKKLADNEIYVTGTQACQYKIWVYIKGRIEPGQVFSVSQRNKQTCMLTSHTSQSI